MDPVEQSLLQALQAAPEDWSIRLMVARKMVEREAHDEAGTLVASSPTPPPDDETLQQAIELGGTHALPIAEAYVAAHPSNPYAHHVLGMAFETLGDSEQAQKHFQVEQALGAVSGHAAPAAAEHAPSPGEIVPEHLAPPAPTIMPGEHVPSPTPSGAMQKRPAQAPPKKKLGSKATAILVAIGVHVAIGLIAALLVVLPARRDEPEIVAAVIGPPSQKQEIQKKNVLKQVKKSTSAAAAAAPVAQLMRANAVAKFSLPNVTKTSTGPLGVGEADFGAGGFGGSGSGLGSGASFFGGSATGQRFLFVVDHSASMKDNQIKLRNEEMERALSTLKGVQYHVLLFAGAGFYAEKGWSIRGTETVIDPQGKSYRFKKKAVTDYEFSGSDSSLPKAKWLQANPSNVKKTMEFVRATKKFGGTDWEMALRIGHYMEPPPDVIFFMADGTGGNSPPPILAINKKRSNPVINTVAMQTSKGAAQFAAVAKGTKGKFTIVDKRGKPIDGFEFLKDPGKFKGRL